MAETRRGKGVGWRLPGQLLVLDPPINTTHLIGQRRRHHQRSVKLSSHRETPHHGRAPIRGPPTIVRLSIASAAGTTACSRHRRSPSPSSSVCTVVGMHHLTSGVPYRCQPNSDGLAYGNDKIRPISREARAPTSWSKIDTEQTRRTRGTAVRWINRLLT